MDHKVYKLHNRMESIAHNYVTICYSPSHLPELHHYKHPAIFTADWIDCLCSIGILLSRRAHIGRLR